MHGDEIRYPDGPEDYQPPELELVCYECNLNWWPRLEGFACPECGQSGEFYEIEFEEQKNGSYVATGRHWLRGDFGIYGEGSTPSAAAEALYARAKEASRAGGAT